MRIAVMGAGAVGGHFGAQLARAGHKVAFIARGQHLEAMRREGLRVISPAGDLHIQNARFTVDTNDVGIVDLILFCVKSYDTESAAASLRPMMSDGSVILSLQNGIDNPEKIARLWGKQRTFAGVVYIGAEIDSPGVIRHAAGGRIIFGQPDGGADDSAQLIARSLIAAGIPSEFSQDIQKVQWTKLLWNAPFCAISCLTHVNMTQIVESEALINLALDCMSEVQAAALTRGIVLPRELFDQAVVFSRGLGEFKPSMLQDLAAGKPLEYEAFNGIVVKLLRQTGKQAPINQTFHAMLQCLDNRIREKVLR
jgi:2-dehydropantoate 2-reductase